MSKTNAFREYEQRVNAIRFDLAEKEREAYARADARKQEVGKDAQYWVEIGTASAFSTALHLLDKSLESSLDIE